MQYSLVVVSTLMLGIQMLWAGQNAVPANAETSSSANTAAVPRTTITGEIRKLGDTSGSSLYHYLRTETNLGGSSKVMNLKYLNLDQSMAAEEIAKYQEVS